MAPERNSRGGGSSLPALRNSALAGAALASAALLSQTTGATPAAADEQPSREEVGQRINSLYDRAENDSRTFNATRASGTATNGGRAIAGAGSKRRPATPSSGTGSGSGSGRSRASADPALDDIAKQWYGVARAKLGPTVEAALPADRVQAAAPPAAPRRERPSTDLVPREPRATERPALEPPALEAPALAAPSRPVLALPSGSAPT
ncbi:hypothetical protein ABZ896_46175, partial [Streptomyces sp. NPDC047072]